LRRHIRQIPIPLLTSPLKGEETSISLPFMGRNITIALPFRGRGRACPVLDTGVGVGLIRCLFNYGPINNWFQVDRIGFFDTEISFFRHIFVTFIC